MKVPQHSILPSVDLKVVASEELEEEVQEELQAAKADVSEPKKMADVLKANKVSKKSKSSTNKTFGSTSSLPTADAKGCCKGKKACGETNED